MQHLVASAVEVKGPTNFAAAPPRPASRKPYFGTAGLPAELLKAQSEFYRDVAVLAFPTPTGSERIADIDEKALYLRDPFSSKPGVKPSLPAPAEFPALPDGATIASGKILDLTHHLSADGWLTWNAPPGNWTILRFGRTSTGANTRLAPASGLGLECEKFDKTALDAYLEQFVGTLLREAVGQPSRLPKSRQPSRLPRGATSGTLAGTVTGEDARATCGSLLVPRGEEEARSRFPICVGTNGR